MQLNELKNLLCDYLAVEARNEARELIRKYFPNTKFWYLETEEAPYEVWMDTHLIQADNTVSLLEYFNNNNIDDDDLREIFQGNPLEYFDAMYMKSFRGFLIEDEMLPELPEELEKYK